jgi:uroporphyrinogen-III synthase
MMPLKLFISAERESGNVLRKFCVANGIHLTSVPLIGFQQENFSVSRPFEVVFFSSKRSLDYFISNYNDLIGKAFATVGKSTACYIKERISEATFVGEKSGDPKTVSAEFKHWLGERRVLFPVSNQSKLTISDSIPEAQKEVIVCYRTIKLPVKIAENDIYVFTSPSNAESFFAVNSIPKHARVIAWGETTAAFLVENGIEAPAVLATASDDELIDVLKTLNP